MELLLNGTRALVRTYHDILATGDPRTGSLPFMSSPLPTIGMTAAYLYFIKSLGPRLMADRKPFDLRRLLVVYNFALVCASGWMFLEMGDIISWGAQSFKCLPVQMSTTDPTSKRIIRIGWWFLFSKYIEFADTIFFVLRKKQSQVTLLHVVHHSVVPISVWTGMKFAPGGSNCFFPFLNSGVHTVMYLYYGLAALGPRMQPYLWWKRYITTLQLAQFTLAIAHGLRALVQDCEFPRSFIFINLFHGVLWFYLFSSFYRNAYTGSKSKMSSVQKQTSSGSLNLTHLPAPLLRHGLLAELTSGKRSIEFNGKSLGLDGLDLDVGVTPNSAKAKIGQLTIKANFSYPGLQSAAALQNNNCQDVTDAQQQNSKKLQ